MSPKSGEINRLGPEIGAKMIERKKSLGVKPDRSAHIAARKKMIERRANKPALDRETAKIKHEEMQRAGLSERHYAQMRIEKPKPKSVSGGVGKRTKGQAD